MPTTNAVISNCLRIFKQSEIVVCLLLLAGDLELNPGPESDFVNCELNTNINFKIKSRGFVVAHLNVRSLQRKLDELKLVVEANTKTIDVLTLSETWLNSLIFDEEIRLPGYLCVRKDRTGHKRGGGTLIYIRENLPYRIRNDLMTEDIECLWIEINRNIGRLLRHQKVSRKRFSFSMC